MYLLPSAPDECSVSLWPGFIISLQTASFHQGETDLSRLCFKMSAGDKAVTFSDAAFLWAEHFDLYWHNPEAAGVATERGWLSSKSGAKDTLTRPVSPCSSQSVPPQTVLHSGREYSASPLERLEMWLPAGSFFTSEDPFWNLAAGESFFKSFEMDTLSLLVLEQQALYSIANR